MVYLEILLLIVIGVLGVASWIKSKRPDLADNLKALESVEGWIGVAGLVMGIIWLLQWLSNMGLLLRFAFLSAIIALAGIVASLALSLILAMPLLRTLLGASDFTNKLAETANRLAPLKVTLGAVCLGVAVFTLIRMI